MRLRVCGIKLPTFRDSMAEVPTIHIPYKKDLIKSALNDTTL